MADFGAAEEHSKIFDLSSVSMPRLLQAFVAQRFTGRVDMIQPGEDGGPRTIMIRDGVPVRCDWRTPGSRLGEVLLDHGLVTDADIDAALAARPTDVPPRPLGQLLVEQEVVDPDAIPATLREQCERRLVALFAAQDGEALVTAGPVLGDDPPIVNVASVLVRGIRAHYDSSRVRRELGARARAVFRRTAELAKARQTLGLTSAEEGIVDRFLEVPQGWSVQSLEAEGIDGDMARRVILALWLCGLLGIAERPAHGVGNSDAEQLASELLSLVDRGVDPTQVLALDNDEPAAEIRRAAASLEASLEPADDLPAEGRQLLAEALEAVAQVRDAALGRREAVARLSMQRALKDGKYTKALPLLEELSEENPDDPELRSSLAWCRLESSSRTPSDLRAAFQIIDEVTKLRPDNVGAHYYRGRVLMELDRRPEALAAFERTLELDPDSIDAQRHARSLRPPSSEAGAPSRRSSPASPSPPSHRSTFWSGAWPAFWVVSVLFLSAMIAAQIALRLDIQYFE